MCLTKQLDTTVEPLGLSAAEAKARLNDSQWLINS